MSIFERVWHSIETKGARRKLGRSRTSSGMCGTHLDLRSQPDPPDGPSRWEKFLGASLAVLGTNSFGVKPETKPTVELVVTASGPRMEETTSPAPDRSQPKHFATTGETYENPPLDLEADDKGTSVPGSESHRDPATHVSQELPQCASSSQLLRFRIYGERESCSENRKKCQTTY